MPVSEALSSVVDVKIPLGKSQLKASNADGVSSDSLFQSSSVDIKERLKGERMDRMQERRVWCQKSLRKRTNGKPA